MHLLLSIFLAFVFEATHISRLMSCCSIACKRFRRSENQTPECEQAHKIESAQLSKTENLKRNNLAVVPNEIGQKAEKKSNKSLRKIQSDYKMCQRLSDDSVSIQHLVAIASSNLDEDDSIGTIPWLIENGMKPCRVGKTLYVSSKERNAELPNEILMTQFSA